MKFTLVTTALAAVVATSSAAKAQTITFNAPVKYGNGGQPAVATNGYGVGQEVEEHMGFVPGFSNQAVPYWFAAGTWGGGFGTVGDYDSGFVQQLAGDSSSASPFFLEVHQGCPECYGLWYRTGTYVSPTGGVSWSSGTLYQSGFFPTAAQASINGLPQFIELHNGTGSDTIPPNPDDQIWVLTGTRDGNGIAWNGGNVDNLASGYNPQVAIWPNGSVYFVLEVHQETSTFGSPGLTIESGPLAYSYGTLQPGATAVNWTHHGVYDSGSYPSIAICSEGANPSVVEVHNGGTGVPWYHTGRISSNNTMTWSNGGQYAQGDNEANFAPHVACTGYFGVEVHVNTTAGTLDLRRTTFTVD
jgi:hypothetical protein